MSIAGMGTIIVKDGRAGAGEEVFSMPALHCAEARSNPSSVATPKKSESKLTGKPHCIAKPTAM